MTSPVECLLPRPRPPHGEEAAPNHRIQLERLAFLCRPTTFRGNEPPTSKDEGVWDYISVLMSCFNVPCPACRSNFSVTTFYVFYR